jgi:5'-AMP-activated protein kinase catalytic alpha subunit
MIAGKKYNAIDVDIWSSGITLFAMMCGFLPFDHQDTSELYKKILSASYSLPKFISDQSALFLS